MNSKGAGIKRFNRAVRKIAKREGVTFAQARAIYQQRQNGNGAPAEGFMPRLLGEMRERMLALLQNPAVGEYCRLSAAYSALANEEAS